MDIFQDISNLGTKKPVVVKTFERRRQASIPEDDVAVNDDDHKSSSPVGASSCSSPSSPSTSPTTTTDAPTTQPSAAGNLSRRGRRSSVLRGAALPGHQLFSSSVQASRSLLLAKMSKARRKAYLAYTKQMADYFAEVDQFELIEESPEAGTGKKARSKLPASTLTGSGPTPLAWGQLQQHNSCSSSERAAHASDEGVAAVASPAAALQAATPAKALQAATPCSVGATASQAVCGSAAAAADVGVGADSEQQQQQQEQPSASRSDTSWFSCTPESPAAASQASTTPQHGTARLQDSSADSSTLAGLDAGMSALSLAAPGTAATEPTQSGGLAATPGAATASAAAAAADAVVDDSLPAAELFASTPVAASAAAAAAAAAAPPQGRSSAAAAAVSGLAASPTPARGVASAGQQQQGNSVASMGDAASLLADTPAAAAAAQQADIQQLVQQVQQLWAATTPEPGSDSMQQQQQQVAKAVAPVAAADAADAAAVEPAAGKPQKQQQQQPKKKGKQRARGAAEPAAAEAAADAEAASVEAAAAAGQQDQQPEAARQQQEQEQQAERHYQAYLQKQAAAAAAAELQALELQATAAAELTPLQQMLQACGQPVQLDQIPAMKDFLGDLVDLKDVVKIGEGTYGEAFKSGQLVLKFVPMEGPNLINGWPQKGAGDLLGEAIIALALTDLGQELDESCAPHASYTDAFVQTHRVGVCRGPYPPGFIKAWKAWDKHHKSENDPIAGLPPTQLYAVFAMANCGRDLESYQLTGYEQVRSMLLQTALALAVAEEALAFEHRDLHWGNIMLSPPQDTHVTARLKGCTVRVRTEGARVRLIDFTASRLQTPRGDVVFCDLELEDGLFDGPKGKPQFETYRRMRKLSRKDWSGHHPGTNVLWLLYLTELLLSSEKPVPGATAAQKRNLREFKKRLGGYSCCSDVIWDELFQGCWHV